MVKNCITASCVVFKGAKVLLHRHKKLNKWLYPGGHVDENEIPTDTAAREVLEETGYRVRLVGARPLGFRGDENAVEYPMPIATLFETVRLSTGTHMHFDLVYLGVAEGERAAVSAEESQDFVWITEKDIDTLDTFGNMKAVLRYAFSASRGMVQ